MRTHARREVSVLTTRGKVAFSRTMLIPQGAGDRALLLDATGAKSLFPMDCRLGISGLPFKITPGAMLKMAFWAQNQSSYQRAEEAIREALHMEVNDDTVRQVSNYVGGVVFRRDCARAADAFALLGSGRLAADCDRDGVLYIQADGAALNTRARDADGSTWRENKLGEVFSSKDIRRWTDKKGKPRHQIMRREYVSYVGAAAEFRKHLFACALRNGYGRYKETVVISDGATWIRNMVEDLFPDAQQILDFFHLAENVHAYARQMFDGDEKRSKPWAENVAGLLRDGRHGEALRLVEPFERPGTAGDTLNLAGYIRNNINNIDYPKYEGKGYFVGSGAIESGNKIVLQDRLKRAGMRWNVETAQSMLTLKSKAESGLWHQDVVAPFLSHCRALSA